MLIPFRRQTHRRLQGRIQQAGVQLKALLGVAHARG